MKPQYNKPGKKHRETKKKAIGTLERVRSYVLEYKSQLEIEAESNSLYKKDYITPNELSKILKLNKGDIDSALLKLANEGLVQRPFARTYGGRTYKRYRVVYTYPDKEKYKIIEYQHMLGFDDCPICNRELTIKNMYNTRESEILMEISKVCRNGCYTQFIANPTEIIDIFGKRFEYSFIDSKGIKDSKREQAMREIKYWKKNDKYLLKLMGID